MALAKLGIKASGSHPCFHTPAFKQLASTSTRYQNIGVRETGGKKKRGGREVK